MYCKFLTTLIHLEQEYGKVRYVCCILRELSKNVFIFLFCILAQFPQITRHSTLELTLRVPIQLKEQNSRTFPDCVGKYYLTVSDATTAVLSKFQSAPLPL